MGRSWEGVRADWRARARREVTDPVRVTETVQTVKTALAGGLAWWVATDLLHLEQAFLAPWAAVLVVHTTVYRTLSRGTQQVAATFLAVLLAFGLGTTLGTTPLSLGLLILVGYLLGRVRWLRDEAGTVATTGLVTLATGAISQNDLLLSRLYDTSIGVVVGLAVNLLVWPPLRDRAAWSHAEQIPRGLTRVVREMAEGLFPDLGAETVEGWVRDVRRVDVQVDQAWSLLWQARESGRMNPRRSQPTGIDELVTLLHRLEQALADTLSMARTVALSAEHEVVWDDRFRTTWSAIAVRAADAVDAGDVDELAGLARELDELAASLSREPVPAGAWEEYGGLVTNLRNVMNSLTEVVRSTLEMSPDQRRRKRPLPPVPRGPGRAARRGAGRLAPRPRGYSEADDTADPRS